MTSPADCGVDGFADHCTRLGWRRLRLGRFRVCSGSNRALARKRWHGSGECTTPMSRLQELIFPVDLWPTCDNVDRTPSIRSGQRAMRCRAEHELVDCRSQ